MTAYPQAPTHEDRARLSGRKWDARFIALAQHVATWSSCVRRQVGAVIVRDKLVLATGVNGPPKGAPHRTADTCVRIGIPSGERADVVCCAHGESNAIAQAAYHGVSVKDATLYVTVSPCAWCARVIINAGITRVVYAEGYPDPLAAQVYNESTVLMEQLPRPEDIDTYGYVIQRHAAAPTAPARGTAADLPCTYGGTIITHDWSPWTLVHGMTRRACMRDGCSATEET